MAERMRKKILVIDDDPDVVTYLATVLRDNGYEVTYAVDGMEALEKLKYERPDLITLDLAMPEKTGIRFYQELKADPEQADIPVLVISALQLEIRTLFDHRLTVSPPHGYFSKPFSVKQLLAAIKIILALNGGSPLCNSPL